MAYFDWSEEEDEIVTANYNIMPADKISVLLKAGVGIDRTPGAIRARAKKLGIAGQAKAYLPNGGRRSNRNPTAVISNDIKRLAMCQSWGVPKSKN